MRTQDWFKWVLKSVQASRLRTLLTALGIAIGIAAVSMLTSIGEGLRVYMMDSFSQFGTRLVAVTPGKNETMGMAGVVSTVRPLSIADAESLRKLPSVEHVVPIVMGTGRIESAERARSSDIVGVNYEAGEAWQIKVALGRFLPNDDPENSRTYAVLGSKMRSELFGTANPLGQFIRVGEMRFRVIGVMESKGQFLGTDLDDMVYIPADKALQLFNRPSLQEIDVVFSERTTSVEIADRIKQHIVNRHGEDDITLFTQEDMLSSLDRILSLMKIAIAGLGGISLVVGGVGVLTIMTTALRERKAEIGLLCALGTTRQLLMALFLGEAIALSVMGGLLGLMSVVVFVGVLMLFVPGLPVVLQPLYLLLALLLSAGVGLIAGIAPAWRASQIDPIKARFRF